jgi:large subunit GTPase 1
MIGLVGYPNVGKSSTINALIGAKKVSVSATPGKTKHFQTLVLTEDITLCDCPGLVFPQFANTQADLVCDGVLPIDQMREYSAPADLVCRRIPRAILEGTYGIRIDVKEIEDGGTGKVGWEELLSAYAIARGMTRSSFGMPDTSRAARYVLKDYVNAKLLYARPPPGIDSDEFMSTSHQRTLEALAAQYAAGRKMQPETHVRRNADTYVAPSGASAAPSAMEEEEEHERAPTHKQVRQSAATAPMRSGKVRAKAFDNVFFTEAGPAPRPVVKGRSQGAADASEGGLAYTRSMISPHQRRLGPDGMPLLDEGPVRVRNTGKKHFKIKEGKKRSGRGYD